MVFTTLAWRTAYHHFLLLKMFEVNLTPSPRTQKSPARRKLHDSSPRQSVPVMTSPNTHPGGQPNFCDFRSRPSSHCHRRPGSCSADSEQFINSLLNYAPSLGCDGQKPFWTMFLCNVDRNNWQELMGTVTSKGWHKLRQVHAAPWFALELTAGSWD